MCNLTWRRVNILYSIMPESQFQIQYLKICINCIYNIQIYCINTIQFYCSFYILDIIIGK